MLSFLSLPVVVTVLSLLCGSAYAQDEVPPLLITPLQAAYQVGENATFSCVAQSGVVTPLLWTLPSGVVLPFDVNQTLNSSLVYENDSRIVYDGAGNMALSNLNLNDSGTYQCSSFDLAQNATQEVKVYVMPDYITETIILLAINGGLLVIFIICSVLTLIQNRKEVNLQRKQRAS